MGFKFAKSEIELEYLGKSYSLTVNTRMAVDLEKHIGIHPIVLMLKINKAVEKGEMPPLGLMAEFFEFMIKRAGCRDVELDDVYGELFGGGSSIEISTMIGSLLGLFIPQADEGEKKDPKLHKPSSEVTLTL
jgi:hypothetical protein